MLRCVVQGTAAPIVSVLPSWCDSEIARLTCGKPSPPFVVPPYSSYMILLPWPEVSSSSSSSAPLLPPPPPASPLLPLYAPSDLPFIQQWLSFVNTLASASEQADVSVVPILLSGDEQQQSDSEWSAASDTVLFFLSPAVCICAFSFSVCSVFLSRTPLFVSINHAFKTHTGSEDAIAT